MFVEVAITKLSMVELNAQQTTKGRSDTGVDKVPFRDACNVQIDVLDVSVDNG